MRKVKIDKLGDLYEVKGDINIEDFFITCPFRSNESRGACSAHCALFDYITNFASMAEAQAQVAASPHSSLDDWPPGGRRVTNLALCRAARGSDDKMAVIGELVK